MEANEEKKWVCVASCPCVVHLGGRHGWETLRRALQSRGEELLLEKLEALVLAESTEPEGSLGLDTEVAQARLEALPPPQALQETTRQALPPVAPSLLVAAPEVVAAPAPAPAPPPAPAPVKHLLEGEIDPNDL